MTAPFLALAAVLGSSLLIQFLLVLGYTRRLSAPYPGLIADEMCPRAAVVLCLRGGDPFLEKCIDGLVTQNYPNFQVHVMIDHPEDPAVAILRGALAKHPFTDYEIHTLQSPKVTCSLKCSSLVQAISNLSDDVDFVALLDADTIPHPSWLREMATALQPAEVGAVTGNRWYMPEVLSQGALIRYIWNAAAVVQMYWYSIAWGGTVAMKLDSIRKAGLLERWSGALCEDTMLQPQLNRIGQRLEFVPSLMMVNREDCSVGSYVRWVKRQLLTTRLYHPLWFAVVFHGISSAALLIWGWMAVVVLLLQQSWLAAAMYGLLMIVFQGGLSLMLPWLESSVKKIVRRRGEPTDWNQRLSIPKLVWIIVATQWIYTWALFGCMFMRRVEWRGVEYEVGGAYKIRLLGYRPWRASEKGQASLQSL